MLDKIKHILLDDDDDDEYDTEISDLIDAALLDLGLAGVKDFTTSTTDALILRAVTTYCKMNFRNPVDYDALLASYNMQKAQLGMALDYVDED